MRKLLYALLFTVSATPAWAQCNGVFPPSTLCGNLSASPAPPSAFPASTVVGPGPTTANGLVLWGNTSGTQLKDGAGQTIVGNYTWSGAQVYSSLNTFGGAVNFTSAFQVSGNAITWPGVAGSVPFLGINNVWTGVNNFTGTFQIGGIALTLPVSVANGGVNPTNVTFQTFTSGSSNYNTPAGARWIRVRFSGGGGGGGGTGGTTGPTGANGGNSTFGALVANGGLGGVGQTIAGAVLGGLGGTASLGGGNGVAIQGNPGSIGFGSAAAGFLVSGNGGISCFGGGGIGAVAANPGGNAATNSGSGGGGSNSFTSGGAAAGGGSGGCIDAIIVAPVSSYVYTVGTGGAGGVGTGTGAQTGGSGAAGQIVVEEHYNY